MLHKDQRLLIFRKQIGLAKIAGTVPSYEGFVMKI